MSGDRVDLKISNWSEWQDMKVQVFRQLENDFIQRLIDPLSNRSLQYEVNRIFYEALVTRTKELQSLEMQMAKYTEFGLDISQLKKRHQHQLSKINNSLEKLSRKIVYARLAGKYRKD
jgi:hypothetical protein